MLKIVVAGSRTFNNYELLKQTLDVYIGNQQNVEIVSGTARGADQLGEQYAREKGFTIKRFPADWEKYGKRAGYLRNEEMAKYSSDAVIFWDGISKGTAIMIELCKKYKLNYHVVRF